jgi:hypothetical protein
MLSAFEELASEIDEFADENERLRNRILYLQSTLASLCVLMESDIEANRVTATETRTQILTDARGFLKHNI